MGGAVKPTGFERAFRRKASRHHLALRATSRGSTKLTAKDPRMRLKQNWSFRVRERVCLIDCRSIERERPRALAMRAIKCLKGVWWMPWR
jgi:hypothetical protein